jgi:hypothetical protein
MVVKTQLAMIIQFFYLYDKASIPDGVTGIFH